ncbi:hypothetical protein AK812_SmicGene48659, partial [Symbiodinium microadriaticum]
MSGKDTQIFNVTCWQGSPAKHREQGCMCLAPENQMLRASQHSEACSNTATRLLSKAMAAVQVQWEFCRDVQAAGDGVSLVPQDWQPVTNWEMLLALEDDAEEAFWLE